jgi:uncharacterized protein DUF6265
MKSLALLGAAVVVSVATSLLHAQPKDVRPKAAVPAVPAVPSKIDAVAWLKGFWSGEGYGGQVETLMGPPKAGVMLGYFRHMQLDGKPGFYELCAVEEFEGSLRFVIKHFHPNWVGWEEKDYALQARLTRIAKDEAVFGNLAIRRTGKDAIVMELTITGKDGTTRKETMRLRRQAL